MPRERKSQQPTPGPNTQNDSRSESNDVMWVDYIHKIGHQKPWLLFLAFFHFPGNFFSSFGIPHPTSFFLRFPEDFSMFIPFCFTFSHPTWPCDLAPGRPTGPSRWWWASTAVRSPLPSGWCRKGRCWQRAKSTRPKAKRSAAGDALRLRYLRSWGGSSGDWQFLKPTRTRCPQKCMRDQQKSTEDAPGDQEQCQMQGDLVKQKWFGILTKPKLTGDWAPERL